MGNTFYELDNYQEALLSYNKALEIQPESYNSWYNRGNILYELENYEEALLSYEKSFTD